MPIELSPLWIVTLNVGGWLLLQLGLAWVFLQLPLAWFEPVPPRAWEEGGHFYERFLGVKRWKGLLPDGARWFAGGFEKQTLATEDPAYLNRFIAETRRGELCHVCAILAAPVFFLWNPWWGDLIVITYALAANLPCVLVQRYNRARLLRVLCRVQRRG